MKTIQELELIKKQGCPNMARNTCIQDCEDCDWSEEEGTGLPQGC